MNKLKITTIVLSVFILFSCNNKPKTETNKQVSTKEHQHSDDEAIQLNEGKKWKVDENMMLHIREMEKTVGSFDKNKPEKYPVLADNLKKNLDLLTSNCTMKGQAHDELHKWLLPFIDLANAFSKDKSAEQFAEIQNSFITFNTYFE